MLPWHSDHEEDYKSRWKIAQSQGFFDAAKFTPPSPLRLRDRTGLRELSFVLFVGWLFTGILNRRKILTRVSLVPVGPTGDSSLLVLHHPDDPLATPTRQQSELLDADYFTCPLDRSKGVALTPVQMHLCPVVNKLRYNLAHARPDGDVSGLREPHKTQECCESKKQLLWEYLSQTILSDPDVYGRMVGGFSFPIQLPFEFLKKYLTGVSQKSPDLAILLEETLLWFAMAQSECLVGCPHVTLKAPLRFNEVDFMLYETAGKHKSLPSEPSEGWSGHVQDQSVCAFELTIGHKDEDEDSPASGKDVAKNKLINYLALRSCGFRVVNCHYLSVMEEPGLNEPLRRSLSATDGFSYVCLSQLVGVDIEQAVLLYRESALSVSAVRGWHDRLVQQIEAASETFRQQRQV